MKIINTQQELEALIDDNNNIVIIDDLKINCKIEVKANIKAWDIDARSIKADNIDAWNIKAWNIEAENINACDIHAWDIKAESIEAGDISYSAVCFAYTSINCKSIKGRHDNSKHFALDGEITITNKSEPESSTEKDLTEVVELGQAVTQMKNLFDDFSSLCDEFINKIKNK